MHIQTHVLSGWCIGNLFKLDSRERLFCMLAASLPDLDGLSIIGGWECYQIWHHVIGHNLLFCVLLSFILALFSSSKLKTLLIYFGLTQIHMVMDYFGSGEGWMIYYFWPFDNTGYLTNYCWPLYSWQNLLAGALMVVFTIGIIYWKKRTPLEFIMPKLDKQLVDWFLKLNHSKVEKS